MSEHTLTKSNISNEEMNNMNNDAKSNNLNEVMPLVVINEGVTENY